MDLCGRVASALTATRFNEALTNEAMKTVMFVLLVVATIVVVMFLIFVLLFTNLIVNHNVYL